MNKIAVLLLVCNIAVLPDLIRAQPVYQIQVGEQIPQKDSYVYPCLFHHRDTFCLLSFRNRDFLLYKEGEPEFTIELFDANLNYTESVPVKASLSEYRKLEPIYLDFVENAFFFFASETSFSDGSARSLVFKLNLQGELCEPPIRLGELSGLEKSSSTLYSPKEDTYFKVSKFHHDSACLFLYTQQFPIQGQPTTKLMVKVLDTSLTLLRHKILNLSIPPEYCEFSNILLEKGELFFMVTIQIPFEDKLFKFVTYNFDKDELNYYDFSMEGIKIHTLEAIMLEKGNILIHGLYADPSSRNEVDGLLYFLFDKDNQNLLSTGTVKIPTEQKKISGKELSHLQIREVFIRSNGDVIILSELYWTEVINFTDSEGKLYLQPYYHSDDLLTLYFSKTGTWKWHAWIPREFGSGKEENLGFHSLISDSLVYIIYNDHPDNIQTYESDRIKRVKGNFIPVLATLDLETGVYHKFPFSDHSNRKFKLGFRKEYAFNVSPLNMIWILSNGNYGLIRTNFGGSRSSSKP